MRTDYDAHAVTDDAVETLVASIEKGRWKQPLTAIPPAARNKGRVVRAVLEHTELLTGKTLADIPAPVRRNAKVVAAALDHGVEINLEELRPAVRNDEDVVAMALECKLITTLAEIPDAVRDNAEVVVAALDNELMTDLEQIPAAVRDNAEVVAAAMEKGLIAKPEEVPANLLATSDEVVAMAIERGWIETVEQIPEALRSSPQVVASGISSGLFRREADIASPEVVRDLYESSEDVVVAAIRMGWWREKRYEDVPAVMRENSAAVVSCAMEFGIPNAPRYLKEIPPALKEEEEIVTTGIKGGWYPTWDFLPMWCKGSVPFINRYRPFGIDRAYYRANGLPPAFYLMGQILRHQARDGDELQTLDRESGEILRSVYGQRVRAMNRAWDTIALPPARNNPVVVAQALRGRVITKWDQIPRQLRGNAEVVVAAMEALPGSGTSETSWQEELATDNPQGFRFNRDVEEPARSSLVVRRAAEANGIAVTPE
eukprot:g2188.t1